MEAKKTLSFVLIFHLVYYSTCESIYPVIGLPPIKVDSAGCDDLNCPVTQSEVEKLRQIIAHKKKIIAHKDKIIAHKDKIIAHKDRQSRNDRLVCAFVIGKQINEDAFRDVILHEILHYGPNYKNEVKKAGHASMKRITELPEDLSIYMGINPNTWSTIRFSYFAHWVPYLENCNYAHVRKLKESLDRNSVEHKRYGWAMAKTYKVFCDYIYKNTKATKKFNQPQSHNADQDYVEMIKEHNEWILTDFDLLCLNITAEIIHNTGISGVEWFDESKRLAIPIIENRDPANILECPLINMGQAHLVKRWIFGKTWSSQHCDRDLGKRSLPQAYDFSRRT